MQHDRVAVGARIALHGEVTGTGGSVFGNVVGRRLTDAQCRDFSRTRNGVDWGWFPDPWRFVRCGWVPGERRLFLFQELSANRKTPAEALTYADEPDETPTSTTS